MRAGEEHRMDSFANLITGLVMIYVALMVFPLLLKLFGLGFIADPLIKLINRILLSPFRLVGAALRRDRNR
jgi:hypothetical protein